MEDDGLRGSDAKPIAEVDLWAMFYCLACAVSVIARGTEDVNSEPVLHGILTADLLHYE